LTVAQAVDHPYLTVGVLAEERSNLGAFKEEVVAGTVELPQLMSPVSLHMQPALQLPQGTLREGADLADQQWARRQFSVLWAPMPADYQLDDGPQATKVGVSVD
jgi:hypothetical protein